MASEGAIIPQLVESVTQNSSPSATTCSVPMAGGDISSSALTNIPCLTDFVLDEKTKRELFTDTFCRVCGAVLQFESHRNAHYEGKRHAQKVRLYFLNKELDDLEYKKKTDQKSDRMNFHSDQQLTQDKNKFCSLCNMVFSSSIVAQSHYVGKIHTKKLKQFSGESSEWTAEVSDSSLAEAAVPPVGEQDSAMSPLSEKSNHQEANTEPSSADNNEIDLSDPNKYCKLCCASFNNPLVAQQHYNGKKHARNESRRKMMEEMGDTGLSVDSGGDGIHVCPICNVTLTSIEMYQSHMQGNKHQIKENIVANLMKTTKKTYDSFENELEDYIKVQKARGLAPKTQFRPEKDQPDSAEETEHAPAHPGPNPAAYKYFGHKAMHYPPYNPLHTSDPRMAGWEPPYWPQKPKRMPIKTGPPRKPPPSSPDSTDSSSSSSDDSSDSYKKEKRHKREHRNKERKHHSRSKRENGSSERKKRKIEESDSEKEDSEKEKKSDGAPADKSKNKKEKKDKPSIDKESKKHKKPKKAADQRTEEEMLWDESILGF